MKVSELNAVTDDYYLIENGKAKDLFFQMSFMLNYFYKQKKGLWKLISGGEKIKVPFRFDGNSSGWYTEGDTLDSTPKEAITAAFFDWKHGFGSGFISRINNLKNSGTEAKIDLVTEQLYGMDKALRTDMATAIFATTPGDGFSGLAPISNTTATTEYGGLASNDVVSEDGTKVWTGLGASTASTPITLDLLREDKSEAEYGTEMYEEPDIIATHKSLYNVVKGILQLQQVFTGNDTGTSCKPVAAGFKGVHFEGSDIYPDKYCASDGIHYINSEHCGYRIHKEGNMVRTPWEFIQGSARDKTIKTFIDGEFVCNNRRAFYHRTGVTTS